MPLKNFKVNLKSLMKAVAKECANPKVEQWKNSKSKVGALDSIITGIVKATNRPEQVYMSKLEYQQYAFPNFKVNLKKLIAAVALDYQ
jgi:phage host-nuclease inhibitor protein Gam